MNDKIWRVKLYSLSKNGQWEDRGIGTAQISGEFFEIISEETNLSLLDYKIDEEVYRKQGDTILTWTDKTLNTFAISFQNPSGAQSLLENFCALQGRDIEVQNYNNDIEALPYPNINNLQSIVDILSDLNPANRANCIQSILKDNYIAKVSHEFQLAMQQENKFCMSLFFLIYKLLLQTTNNSILEELLTEVNFYAFIGAMDFDPVVKCTDYVKTLTSEVHFINPLDITDTEFLHKIHSAFRLGFLKDSQTARGFEESTVIFMTSHQIYIYNDIIGHFLDSGEIRASLIIKLKSHDFAAFLFLYEMCLIAKSVNIALRAKFYDVLALDDILSLIETN